jgi:hypothetical protein
MADGAILFEIILRRCKGFLGTRVPQRGNGEQQDEYGGEFSHQTFCL